MSAQQTHYKPHRTPRWVKLLAIAMTLLIILRLTGVIDIPKEWFVGAIIMEIGLAVFELTIFVMVFRHFYRQNRRSGQGKLDAITSSQADELRASGLPEKLARPLEKAMKFELNLYRKSSRLIAKYLKISR